jgi:hypothetical protein
MACILLLMLDCARRNGSRSRESYPAFVPFGAHVSDFQPPSNYVHVCKYACIYVYFTYSSYPYPACSVFIPEDDTLGMVKKQKHFSSKSADMSL